MSIFRRTLFVPTVIFLLFFGVIFLSWLCLTQPENFYRLSFGQYQLSSYRQGLGIFENHRFQTYYNLSPYNDYYIAANDSTKINHWQAGDDSQAQKIHFRPSALTLGYQILTQYFSQSPVRYTFTDSNVALTYQAAVSNDHCLKIDKTVTFHHLRTVQTLGTTLSFNSDDFIFTPHNLQLFSLNSAKDSSVFQNVTERDLLPASTYTSPISINSQQIALKNLNGSAYLLLTLEPGQTLGFDQLNRLLIIETPVVDKSQTSTLTFSLCSFDSLTALEAAL